MKKKYVIVILILFIIVTAGVCVLLKKSNIENISIDKNSWALYNFGQEIEGTAGVEGVDINFVQAQELSKDSSGVLVGIVDTGIEYTNSALSDYLWTNQGEISDNGIDDDGNGYVDDVYGWDFYNQDESIYDGYLYDYHGTYIANMIEIVAPGVQILSSKFLKGTQGEASDAVAAIEYAIANGANIINCSWCFGTEEEELYDLMVENPDVLFICAAGNSHLDLDTVSVYPASYALDNLITVMAIDNTGEKYDLSGYGMNVDIAAPGKDILVSLPEDDTTFVSGTSIATAFVTGTAALMKATSQSLAPSEIKSIIVETSHASDSLTELCKAGGYLDMYNAVLNCQ